MLALLCNAARKERLPAWQRSGRSSSRIDRFRSLTVIRRKDPDWRVISVGVVDVKPRCP